MDKLIRNFYAGSRTFRNRFTVMSAGYIYGKNYILKHRFLTLNFVMLLSGRGSYLWEGRTLNVSAPCVLVQPPDTDLLFGPDPGTTWDEVHFVLPASAKKYICWKKYWDGLTPVWTHANPGRLIGDAAELKMILDQPLAAISLDRLDLLCERMLAECSLPSDHRKEGRYYDLIEMIRRDYSIPGAHKSFDDYALEFRISVPTLRRYWLKYVGQPPARFRIDMQIREACSLLCNTDMSLQEIADVLSFCDQFYFSRLFAQESGYTPSEYRRVYSVVTSTHGGDT